MTKGNGYVQPRDRVLQSILESITLKYHSLLLYIKLKKKNQAQETSS